MSLCLEKVMRGGGGTENIYPHFRSKCLIELTRNTVQDRINITFANIHRSIDQFIHNNSGWTLEYTINFELKIATYFPVTPNGYFPLPNKITNCRAALNIENFNDQGCLIWSLLAHKCHDIYTLHQ